MDWYWIVLIIVAAATAWTVLSAVFYKPFFKRFYDILLSGLALVIFSPLFLILIIAGAIAMQGNPFFVQPRPGKIDPKTGRERIFRLVKFRSMSNKTDGNGKFLPDADRLNRYGRFLRQTSLDELPEVLNILGGDMSLVGPRPQLVRDMVFMTAEQRKRHTVRPGLSGLAQVSGRNAISWEEKLSIDLRYIEKITFFSDLKILLTTAVKIVKREGIASEGMATADDYGVYLLKEGRVSQQEFDEKMKAAEALLSEAGL